MITIISTFKSGIKRKKSLLTYFNGVVKVTKGYIRSVETKFVIPSGEELGEVYFYVCPQSLLVDPDYKIKLKHISNQCEFSVHT